MTPMQNQLVYLVTILPKDEKKVLNKAVIYDLDGDVNDCALLIASLQEMEKGNQAFIQKIPFYHAVRLR